MSKNCLPTLSLSTSASTWPEYCCVTILSGTLPGRKPGIRTFFASWRIRESTSFCTISFGREIVTRRSSLPRFSTTLAMASIVLKLFKRISYLYRAVLMCRARFCAVAERSHVRCATRQNLARRMRHKPATRALASVFVNRSGKFLAGGVLAAFLLVASDGYRLVLDYSDSSPAFRPLPLLPTARFGSEESNILANYSSSKPRFRVLACPARRIERLFRLFLHLAG